MPTESLRNSESNEKRKLKIKAPKRLCRKNKQNNVNTEENLPETNPIITDDTPLIKQKSNPSLSNTSSTTTDNNPVVASIDETSIHYLKCCVKQAMDILAKQASNRRKLLIERHQERINCIQCLLHQRERINLLTEKNHLISQSIDVLRNEVRTKDENFKSLEDKLHDRDELVRDNEFLRVQLRLMEQKFERFTNEYSKKLEDNRQQEHEYHDQIQSLMDEIERIKRDLVLEEYRKQEAERKVRYYDEKIKIEQNLTKKMQQESIQSKQELKSIHMRYDALQIEMLAMHKANNNDLTLIPTNNTNENEWTKKRAMNDDINEQLEVKRSKRKTRHRTESSASATSNSSETQNKIETKLSKNKENNTDSSSPPIKRKTLKSNKNHLPMVTVTQASPSTSQSTSMEKDPAQLLLPSSVSATSDGSTPTSDSHDTSCDSQPMKPRLKKPSRYPCRRAQRPVKQIETNNQVQ